MNKLNELAKNSNLSKKEKNQLSIFFKHLPEELAEEFLAMIKRNAILLERLSYFLNKKQQILNQKDEKGWEKLIQEEAKDIETFLNKKESSKTLQ